MPTNNYKCQKCEHKYKFIGPYKQLECPECGELNTPLLPTNVPPASSFELVDRVTGIKWRDNQEERYRARAANHLKLQAKERARDAGMRDDQQGLTEDDGKLV